MTFIFKFYLKIHFYITYSTSMLLHHIKIGLFPIQISLASHKVKQLNEGWLIMLADTSQLYWKTSYACIFPNAINCV